ncbi:hypothetical protein [Woodsholea maritima]|uniref:hypothetical protein n=1 Tax=Woodsholea maritima TaxID=240237 RepID=UPI00036C5191|nr:hypothetical protein [Woodsholea maritima]
MAIFQGLLKAMSSGYGVTRLPLIKRGAVEIGDKALSNLILPAAIDARLENDYGNQEVRLYTGRFIFNRLVMAAKVEGRSVFMGPISAFMINLILIPLFFASSFVVVIMALFFAGLGETNALDPFILYGGIGWAVLGLLRVVSNFKSLFMLG